jgi:hypothetical protein
MVDEIRVGIVRGVLLPSGFSPTIEICVNVNPKGTRPLSFFENTFLNNSFVLEEIYRKIGT